MILLHKHSRTNRHGQDQNGVCEKNPCQATYEEGVYKSDFLFAYIFTEIS